MRNLDGAKSYIDTAINNLKQNDFNHILIHHD